MMQNSDLSTSTTSTPRSRTIGDRNRNQRACENCRQRRVKCSGSALGDPCHACLAIGLGDKCHVRSKIRPKRLPRIAQTRSRSHSPRRDRIVDSHDESAIGRVYGGKFGNLVEAVERDLSSWAESRGTIISLILSDIFPIRRAGADSQASLPTPADAHRLRSYVEISLSNPYLEVVYVKLPDILQRYLQTQTQGHFDISLALASDQDLRRDERALLFACFCVGAYTLSLSGIDGRTGVESTSIGIGSRLEGLADDSHDHVVWYRQCLIELDAVESVNGSTTALVALHFLHTYSIQAGGVVETRDILRRMAEQVRALGIEALTTNEASTRLLFATLYKDSWYATICSSPPFLDTSTYIARIKSAQSNPSSGEDENANGNGNTSISYDLHRDRAPVAIPLIMQLTEFENELTTELHRPASSSSSRKQMPRSILNEEWILNTTQRWSKWIKSFREQSRSQTQSRGKPMLYIFANMRIHWLQLLLHYPPLDSPPHYASSSNTIARCISQIIGVYHELSSDNRYMSSWPDLRRITTCAQVALILYDRGELIKDEVETLLSKVYVLFRLLEKKYPMIKETEEVLGRLTRLAGLDIPLREKQTVDTVSIPTTLTIFQDQSLPLVMPLVSQPQAPSLPLPVDASVIPAWEYPANSLSLPLPLPEDWFLDLSMASFSDGWLT